MHWRVSHYMSWTRQIDLSLGLHMCSALKLDMDRTEHKEEQPMGYIPVCPPPPPQKKNNTTRLLASISFEIANWSENALGLQNSTLLSAFQRKPHPIWFNSHKEIRICVRQIISPFHPKFDRKETHTTQWTLNFTLLLNGLCKYVNL